MRESHATPFSQRARYTALTYGESVAIVDTLRVTPRPPTAASVLRYSAAARKAQA